MRVSDILELRASGESHQAILEDYPYRAPGDLVAALQFAARQADHPILRSA